MEELTMFKSNIDIHTTKDIQDLGTLEMTELLKLYKVQNNLLRNDDVLIERFTLQLSEYEQELYENDVYITKMEDKLEQVLKASRNKGDVL
jgi:hypothetical protein